MEEERKILEKEQYRIEAEYEGSKKLYESELNECISKDGLSQEEQQDCYVWNQHWLDTNQYRRDKQMETAQKHFDEQIAFQCSICKKEMDCADNITVLLPCLHEFHTKCLQDFNENNPWRSNQCPFCWRRCYLEDPIDLNLESTTIMNKAKRL